VSTSVILITGFSVFLTASMRPLQRFGILSGIAILFALLFDLILNAALLRTFYTSRNHSNGVSQKYDL
jgi:predicted RND superfamily exporter protein